MAANWSSPELSGNRTCPVTAFTRGEATKFRVADDPPRRLCALSATAATGKVVQLATTIAEGISDKITFPISVPMVVSIVCNIVVLADSKKKYR